MGTPTQRARSGPGAHANQSDSSGVEAAIRADESSSRLQRQVASTRSRLQLVHLQKRVLLRTCMLPSIRGRCKMSIRSRTRITTVEAMFQDVQYEYGHNQLIVFNNANVY